MSRQFFGLAPENNGQHQQQNYQTSDPFAQMFGSASENVPQRPPPQNYRHPNPHQANPPHRQGYYAPQQTVQQQLHPPYNGPPPVYGQQQGFGQRQPDSNGSVTDGYPPDNQRHPYVNQVQHPHQEAKHPYPPVEYQPHQHHQQAIAVEYAKPVGTVVEYQPHYQPHTPQQVEYHHAPVLEHQGPTLEIHTGTQHAYPEPPTHIEYHHPPKEEYHYTTHKPKRFHLSFNEPSPDYRIIDKHLKLPPVKFRFHINPKIVITSNTKDPLEKKHHDDEHDLEPYPPPDAFSDPNAPPQISKHIVEHYPVKHHYPIEHHAVEHYPAEYPQAKHAYPVEHHAVEHHPVQGYTYDLSHGHSHLNPHRSLGHYEPTFKIKTKPIIFTEPPPTRPTTTRRPTTTTARTTTARTTTTVRPTRRARISARNPGFSVAFTQSSTISTTTDAPTTASTTTRRSFRSNSERERENDGISARRDEISTSAEMSSSAQTTPSIISTTSTPKSTTSTTTTTTTTKPITTTTTTTTTTTMKPATFPTTTTTTTMNPVTSTSPTTTMKPTTSSATTSTTTTTTTAAPTTFSSTTLRTTTPSTITTTYTPTTTPITSSTAQSAAPPSTTTTTTTTSTAPTTSQSTSKTPAEETTPRSTTLSIDVNEIDMRKATESPRRRPEPFQDKPSNIDRSESFNLESSESVKVIETTMLIDGKNQTVRFYYITQPVKLPLDVFQKMTGQGRGNPSGVNVIKIRDKRFVLDEIQTLEDL